MGRKIDITVSEHDKALARKNNLTTIGEFWVDLLQCHHQLRVLRLHPHLSPQFPSQEVSLRNEPSYMCLTQSIKAKKRRSTSILYLLVPESLFEKKQSMSYNEDVNVKRCACSDPSCNQWSDLYPHVQVTRRNMWAKKVKSNLVQLISEVGGIEVRCPFKVFSEVHFFSFAFRGLLI
ncbi:hypothetical protein YC2023_040437 [Brassica napus]